MPQWMRLRTADIDDMRYQNRNFGRAGEVVGGGSWPTAANSDVQLVAVCAKHGLIGLIITNADACVERACLPLDVVKRIPFVPLNFGAHFKSPIANTKSELYSKGTESTAGREEKRMVLALVYFAEMEGGGESFVFHPCRGPLVQNMRQCFARGGEPRSELPRT